MASHSPEIRAEAAMAIISGELTWTAATERYGCSRSTLASWVKQARKQLGHPDAEPTRSLPRQSVSGAPRSTPSLAHRDDVLAEADERTRMRLALFDLARDTIRMLQGQAKVAGDPAFVREQPEKAIELGRFVLGRTDALVAAIGVDSPREPVRGDEPERVDAELVE